MLLLETWCDSTILVKVEGGWAVYLITVTGLLVQAIPLLAMDFQQKNGGTSAGDKSLKSMRKAKVLAPSSTRVTASYFFTCSNSYGCPRDLQVSPTTIRLSEWDKSRILLWVATVAMLPLTIFMRVAMQIMELLKGLTKCDTSTCYTCIAT